MDLDRTLRGISGPAFVVDIKGRVTDLNASAESLFGAAAGAICGLQCWDLFDGLDPWGNRFCHPHCVPLVMAGRNEAVADFEVRLRTAPGKRLQVAVSIVPLYDSRTEGHRLLHLVRPVTASHPGEGSPTGARFPEPPGGIRPIAPAGLRIAALTGRELVVLRLLAAGRSPQAIATELAISVRTVRNHLRNIFEKLQVHRQAEAVCLALRAGLI